MFGVHRLSLNLGASIGLLLGTATFAHAAKIAAYPVNTCVAAKQKAAGTYCKNALKIWGTWDKKQDNAKRDAALTKAAGKLASAWTKSEEKSTASGVDCAPTTANAAAMAAQIGADVAAIVTAVNNGLTLTNPDHAKCGAKLLGAAANACAAYLKAESAYITNLAAGKTDRDAARTKANGKLLAAVTKATTAGPCPTAATATTLQSAVADLVTVAVTDTIVSPNVDNTQFVTISPTGSVAYQGRQFVPLCSKNTPYVFFARRGSVNKLLMYYQGGGACWDTISCNVGTCDQTATAGDNPDNYPFGFGDLNNPDNPFKDWNIVFTSYCSCDVHFGDSDTNYGGLLINHHGFPNARVVEKWAREHFVNPDEIFVTGSSAGAYGALFNAPLLARVWPDSQFSVLGDAGNGVLTPDFLNTPGYGFQNWQFEKNLPPEIPGLKEAITSGEGVPAYTKAVATYFPNTAWGHYTTAYDGNLSGQTGFYNVMLNPGNPAAWEPWWNATCAWHDNMVDQAQSTYTDLVAAGLDNYRYYIGRGSQHTGWFSDAVVYSTDAIGDPVTPLPALKDWVTSMLARDTGWVNVQCTECDTLRPGDPAPAPLASPFVQNGPDVEITCP